MGHVRMKKSVQERLYYIRIYIRQYKDTIQTDIPFFIFRLPSKDLIDKEKRGEDR